MHTVYTSAQRLRGCYRACTELHRAALNGCVFCLPVSSWVGYEYDNFRGRQYLWDMSDRGEYNSCDKWSGPVDHVSSVRAVRQVRDTQTDAGLRWIQPQQTTVLG